MGKKTAKAMSRDAFIKVFVEAEVTMRQNLAARIDVVIQRQENPDIIAGLELAKEVIIGTVEK